MIALLDSIIPVEMWVLERLVIIINRGLYTTIEVPVCIDQWYIVCHFLCFILYILTYKNTGLNMTYLYTLT